MIVLGADTHKSSHTIAAVDTATGRVLGDKTVAVGARGFAALVLWARGLDGERVWALEDCRHVSGALERFLIARGERVVRVSTRLMAGTRRSSRERGKSDQIDGVSVARASLAAGIETLPTAAPTGPALDLRLLVDHRERLVRTRVALNNTLQWNLHDLWPELTLPSGALLSKKWTVKIARRPARAEQTMRVRIARDELRRMREPTRAIKALQANGLPNLGGPGESKRQERDAAYSRSVGARARGLAQARRLGRELARIARPTPLDHAAGPARRVAFASAPFAACRAAAKAIDPAMTVNDVVLGAVAGGMGAWLAHRGLPREGIRVKVPVSLHDASGRDDAANRDSYFFVDLPVGEPDVAERLRAVNRQTVERKPARCGGALRGDPEVLGRPAGDEPGRVHAERLERAGASRGRLRAGRARARAVLRGGDRGAPCVACRGDLGRRTLFFGLCADRDVADDLEVVANGIKASVLELVAPAGG